MLSAIHTSTPIIFFFSAQISPKIIRDYKKKCLLLDNAVRDKLKVNINSLQAKAVSLVEFGLDDGCFYGVRNVKGKLVKTVININKIKYLGKDEQCLNIIYSVLW